LDAILHSHESNFSRSRRTSRRLAPPAQRDRRDRGHLGTVRSPDQKAEHAASVPLVPRTKWLTVAEVAARADRSVSWIQQMCREGWCIDCRKGPDGRWRISEDECERFIRERDEYLATQPKRQKPGFFFASSSEGEAAFLHETAYRLAGDEQRRGPFTSSELCLAWETHNPQVIVYLKEPPGMPDAGMGLTSGYWFGEHLAELIAAGVLEEDESGIWVPEAVWPAVQQRPYA
jgi:hypothetical protein